MSDKQTINPFFLIWVTYKCYGVNGDVNWHICVK
jgi:hypothetical protein